MLTEKMDIEEARAWLLAGYIPDAWQPSGSDLFYNKGGRVTPALSKAGVTGWNREFARWATDIILSARKKLLAQLAEGGATGKLDNPDCYSFTMQPNYPLTTSMVEAGWKQWHTNVQTKSKEECAELGARYKKYRYAVYCWVSPDGKVVLAKLKLNGKHIPDFADTVARLGADLLLVEKACEAIRAIPAGKMAEMMADDDEPDIGKSTGEAFADYVLREFTFAQSHYYGMVADDHAAVFDVMEWLAKHGFEEPARLLLQTSEFNTQSEQDIEATIEEWKREWSPSTTEFWREVTYGMDPNYDTPPNLDIE